MGVRFQPFMLPEFTVDTSDLAGKGLFDRGLHFPGSITPGNVSVLCLCDSCKKSFRLGGEPWDRVEGAPDWIKACRYSLTMSESSNYPVCKGPATL